MIRVEIVPVLAPAEVLVRFRSGSAFASGRWMGSSPVNVGQLDVEIEIPEEVVEWMTVRSGDTSLSETAETESDTILTGQVVRFDDGDDSIIEIRVGSDILLIEIPDRRDMARGELISFRGP